MADPMLLAILLQIVLLFGFAGSSDVVPLLRLRDAITSDPGGLIRGSWDGNKVDQSGCPLQWHGVTCSTGHVTGLLLSDLSLVGEIPRDSIGRLTGLSSLVLSNNSFQGELPSDLGSLVQLTTLDLSNNNFTGGVPALLFNLKNLRNFSLAGNQLSGVVPEIFSGMPQLLDLNFGSNLFSGSLPSSLASLQQLVSLDLSRNSFSGVTSRDLSKMAALRRLDLHQNRLSGLVDPSLMSLSQLELIDVSSNQFTDQLPWQQDAPMIFPQRIAYVNLSNNRFSGELAPENSANLFASKLETLDVSSNSLSGKLPAFNFAFSIKVLRLQNNSFSGFIPGGLLSVDSSLEELDISSNQLEGQVPTIIKASSLLVLKLSSNRFSGSLPTRLGSAAEIDLSNNQFTGNISVMAGWGDGLQKLDLSGNALTGHLPNETEHLIRLIHLNISHNNVTGSVPALYATFGKLTTLDLSFNALDGEIPGKYFHSPSLSTLKLSNNRLSGAIPVLSSLSASTLPDQLLSPASTVSSPAPGALLFAPLQVLDLSSNSLNGSVPQEIASLTALQSLNLSRNKFTGVIPSQLSSLRYLDDLDLSFNHFTGHIPEHLPASLQTLNLSHNDLSGVIPGDLMRFPLSSFFPGNVGLRAPAGSSLGSPGLLSGRRRGLSSAVKAGLIGGCVAAAAIIIALGTFIYLRRRSSRFEEIEQGFDQRKGQERGFDSQAPPERVGSMSLSREQLLPGPSEQRFFNEGVEAEGVSPAMVPAFQHSTSLKSRSPDKLAGDLSLLNTSIVFTPEELSSAPAEVLGRSSHGTSYKATLESGHTLTVKWLREGLARDKKAFTREANKFGSIQHPNVVPLRGYYWGPKEHEKLIISDYLSGGSLADRLSERRPPALDWSQRLSIANDIAQGLMYLHVKHKLPHGNLKATNVLLDEGPVARLSDYCVHRLMTEAGTANQIVNAGALGYRAPELAHTGKPKPTLKADVYALGVILLEILTGKGAGDIISGNSGAVDLTDWVKVMVSQGRGRECYDQTLLAVVSEEQEQQIERVLGVALRCISQQRSERPGIKSVSEGIAALLPR